MSDVIERLRNYRIGCGIHCSHYHTLEPLDECVEAADEIERLRTQVAALCEALENLLDEQNGPPLIGSAASWQAAVDQARAALATGGERE